MDTYTIYRIRDNETDETYIGSTKQKLEERLRIHKKNKDCKSRKIIDNNNYECRALLLLKCNKTTARWLERFSIENHYKVVNSYKSIKTKEERLREGIEYRREYYKNNKEYFKEYNEKQRALKQETYICECGRQLKITNAREYTIKRHEKSKKHIKYFNLKKTL